MKFSFIIPSYNEEKYIKRCIKSIRKQTRKPEEIIVVDNTSTDNTPEIAEALGCRVVKEEKKGISNARNKGAKVAQGDFLCFIDADGVLTERWLEECEKTLLREKGVKAVVGLNIFSHKKLGRIALYNIYTLVAYSGLFIFKMLTNRLFLPGNNLAIRKDVFMDAGGFEEIIAEDYWLSKKFWKLADHKGVFNPKMTVYYSSRGFESAGFFKTISFWVLGGLMKIHQKDYTYKSKRIDFKKLRIRN